MQDFLILLAYLIGSIPFGVIFARIFATKDLRSHGSGNIGATNMLRVGGKKPAIYTLICDLLKGTIAVIIVTAMSDDMLIISASYIAAILGHIFPVWLKFKGGKGVATNIGVMIAISPMLALWVAICWVSIFKLTGISSLSALLAMVLSPFIASMLGFSGYILWAVLINAIIVIAMHHSNIKRLLAGEEKRVK